jgi:iron-sulfur cluster repair protein YtfE (RIC family)|nr:hemerythrin domain-containing protein [Kofleriaceae bacterium]
MADAIDDLAHDHREINRQVLDVAAALRALRHDDAPAVRAFSAAISTLHDMVFSHFAREEEGLFPYLGSAFPELADRVQELTIAHDTICGALTRARYLASADGDVATVRALYDRFELAYASHASRESALLRDIDERLDSSQRAVIADLLDDL